MLYHFPLYQHHKQHLKSQGLWLLLPVINLYIILTMYHRVLIVLPRLLLIAASLFLLFPVHLERLPKPKEEALTLPQTSHKYIIIGDSLVKGLNVHQLISSLLSLMTLYDE